MRCLLFFGLLSISISSWALLTSEVDRTAMLSNETLKLTITSDKERMQLDGKDTNLLTADFDILGQSSQSSIQIINGRTTQRFSTVLTLSPKTTGTLTIPEFSYGTEKAPAISISVKDVADIGTTSVSIVHAADAVFDDEQTYVQGQAVVTFRITSPHLLVDHQMAPLELKDVRIEKLKDGNFQKQNPDTLQIYYVYEISYALFPQYSGEINIPAQAIQAVFSRDNQFSQVWGSVRSRHNLERKILRTKNLTLDVLPKPSSLPNAIKNRWLPAKSVTLNEHWNPSPDTARLGDALTRKVVITATGFPAEQIPDIELAEHSALKIYQEPDINTNQQEGRSILGVREVTFSYVPTQKGAYELPEIQLPWWNTKTQQLETAILPARRIMVDGSTAVVLDDNKTQIQQSESSNANSDSEDDAISDNASTDKSSLGYDVWVMGLAVLLIVLLLAFIFVRLRVVTLLKKLSSTLTQKRLHRKKIMKDLELSCRDNNSESACQHVIAWANMQFPEQPHYSLGDIVNLPQVKQHDNLHTALHALNTSLYGKEAQNTDLWHGKALWEAISQFSIDKLATKQPFNPVKSLYLSENAK